MGYPWQARQDHDQRQGRAMPPGSRQPPVQGTKAERSLALRLHLRRDLEGFVYVAFVIDACCPQDIGLASLAHGACGLRARCAGAGTA